MKHRKDIRKFKTFSLNDKKRLDFYRQFISKNDLVFDVGANLGNRSKLFLELYAKVIAFEPQIYCAAFLKKALGTNENFILEKTALGERELQSKMFISDQHTLSTLSRDWINSTHDSGRFSDTQWRDTQDVRVSTLDIMIEKYGLPKFLKIDVEGYEFEVISGLSRAIKYISLEFAAENIDITKSCLQHLLKLGDCVFQYSEEESMLFNLKKWSTFDETMNFLEEQIRKNRLAFGDIYVRMK